MSKQARTVLFFLFNLFTICAFADNAYPVRIIVMPYKLQGDFAGGKPDAEHENRLKFADLTLRSALSQNPGYQLVDEASSLEFSKTVSAALSNNACDHCEAPLAKQLKAKEIVIPWVYRLSQLVLTMHFVILDAETGKTRLKKALDFRGDNDESWQRAIRNFVRNLDKFRQHP